MAKQIGIGIFYPFKHFIYTMFIVFICQVGVVSANEDLLNFLIAQNEAALEKIKSYSYTIELEWESEMENKRQIFRGMGEVKREGDYLWSNYRRTAFNNTEGKMQEIELRVVVNDKYMATWPMKGNPVAYQNDHSTFDTINPKIKTRIKINTPYNFLPFCFGESIRPFRKSINLHPGKTKWDAVEIKEPDGKLLYHIRRFVPIMDDPSKPDMIWKLDPEKGFLATETIAYKPNGDIWINRSMQIREIAKGVWFPVDYTDKRYGTRKADQTHAVTEWRKAKLKNVKVNENFPDKQFDIDALRLKEDKPDIIVLRTRLDGEKIPYVYTEGRLLPQEIVGKIDYVINKTIDSEIDSKVKPMASTLSQSAPVSLSDKQNQVHAEKSKPTSMYDQKKLYILLGIFFTLIVLCIVLALSWLRGRKCSDLGEN